MDIDSRYFNYIDNIAEVKAWKIEDLVIYLIKEMKNNIQFKDFIVFRQKFLTNSERNSLLFSNLSRMIDDGEEETMVIIAIAKDIHSISNKMFSRKKFEQYHLQQNVFKEYPELFEELRLKSNNNKDFELVKLNAINYDPIPNNPEHGYFKYKNHYLFIDSYLDSRIPRFLIDNYGKDEIYIRIDPYSMSKTVPLLPKKAEFSRPPNPKWARILRIFPGKPEGSKLYLPTADEIEELYKDHPEIRKKKYWESEMKKIRKLEIIASMKNESKTKHFSMSLEELSEESIADGKLIGRMIHLDALDAYEMPFEKIKLNHLDLAINVYTDGAIKERMNTSLDSGGVITDASYRTHLIRIDNIMFSDLLKIARLFFKSETMVEEWIDTQFEFLKDK